MPTYAPLRSSPVYSGSTPKPVTSARNNTDVITPVIKLFVEGVELAFESISISQVYQSLPTASIQVPPASGLIDILRGYNPKVHIFYEDVNTGGFRLLFWGHIRTSSYSRTRNGSSSINFQCTHKNTLLGGFTLDFTGWVNPNHEALSNVGLEAGGNGLKPTQHNSALLIVQALAGINGVATDQEAIRKTNTDILNAPVDKADPYLTEIAPRLVGMAGVSVNLWNQLKKGALLDSVKNLGFLSMWAPLLEESVAYFKRTTGHPVLENKLQEGKTPYCHIGTANEIDVIVPPYFRTPFLSAVQGEIAYRNVSNVVTYSGELTTVDTLMDRFYEGCVYDKITLASPAEVPADPLIYQEDVSDGGIHLSTSETIIKPRMPVYFSPTCNVLLPRMYTSIQIDQDEASAPTRMTIFHDAIGGQGGTQRAGTSYLAPASFREAVAYNFLLVQGGGTPNGKLNLADTKGYTYSMPAKYELGSGIRTIRINMPWWLATLEGDKYVSGAGQTTEASPNKDTPQYTSMMLLAAEWDARYSTTMVEVDGDIITSVNLEKQGLNPYNPATLGISAHERMLYGMVDYEFAEKALGTRTGMIDAVFNPYIIPGYPMDVIDDSPNHPSFHGFCTSVTHTITAQSIGTTIGITAAMTYAEMSNYYLPPVPPFLLSALNLVNGDVDANAVDKGSFGDTSPFTNTKSTLLQNPIAKKTADIFYKQVLGVGAVAPDDLIHFSSGRAYPVQRLAGSLVPMIAPDASGVPDLRHFKSNTGREDSDFYSTVGNLRMVSRPIESLNSIESKFNLTFIPLDPLYYNNSYVNYVNPLMAKNLFLEPGASLFLDYMEIKDFIKL